MALSCTWRYPCEVELASAAPGEFCSALLLALSCFSSALARESDAVRPHKRKLGCHAADGSGNASVARTLVYAILPHLKYERKIRATRGNDCQRQKETPGYEKSLKKRRSKNLVAYIRELSKKNRGSRESEHGKHGCAVQLGFDRGRLYVRVELGSYRVDCSDYYPGRCFSVRLLITAGTGGIFLALIAVCVLPALCIGAGMFTHMQRSEGYKVLYFLSCHGKLRKKPVCRRSKVPAC